MSIMIINDNYSMTYLIVINTGCTAENGTKLLGIGLHTNFNSIQWLTRITTANGSNGSRKNISGNRSGISNSSRSCSIRHNDDDDDEM